MNTSQRLLDLDLQDTYTWKLIWMYKVTRCRKKKKNLRSKLIKYTRGFTRVIRQIYILEKTRYSLLLCPRHTFLFNIFFFN